MRILQGCRFTMRGADERGHVANFVETEQALLFDTGATASYVQVREEATWAQHLYSGAAAAVAPPRPRPRPPPSSSLSYSEEARL